MPTSALPSLQSTSWCRSPLRSASVNRLLEPALAPASIEPSATTFHGPDQLAPRSGFVGASTRSDPPIWGAAVFITGAAADALGACQSMTSGVPSIARSVQAIHRAERDSIALKRGWRVHDQRRSLHQTVQPCGPASSRSTSRSPSTSPSAICVAGLAASPCKRSVISRMGPPSIPARSRSAPTPSRRARSRSPS